jgi:hypothetical protein
MGSILGSSVESEQILMGEEQFSKTKLDQSFDPKQFGPILLYGEASSIRALLFSPPLCSLNTPHTFSNNLIPKAQVKFLCTITLETLQWPIVEFTNQGRKFIKYN